MTDHKRRWSVPPPRHPRQLLATLFLVFSALTSAPLRLCGEANSSLGSAHHYPEPVIGVAEFGRDAAPRGTTRELDVVPPSSASRCAADTVRRALRVHVGRRRVPGRIV